MIRSQLVKDLRRYTGAGVVTAAELTKYLGYRDRKSVRKYTRGLQRFGAGYSIEDVADRIMEVRR